MTRVQTNLREGATDGSRANPIGLSIPCGSSFHPVGAGGGQPRPRGVEMATIVIEIVEYGTDNVVKTVECKKSRKIVYKVEDGININLDHSRFYTRIKEDQP